MADKTQEERDKIEAKRKAAQERARKRKAEKSKKDSTAGTKKDSTVKTKTESKLAVKTSPRPAARPKASEDKDSTYVSSGRGDGAAEMRRRRADQVTKLDTTKVDASMLRNGDPKIVGPMMLPSDRKNVTYEDWKNMTREERRKAGLPVSTWGASFRLPGMTTSPRRGRNPARMAKGGIVKANCGASMKPDGKRKK